MRVARCALALLPFVAGCFTVQTASVDSDAEVAPEPPVDVVGNWHDCGRDLQLRADGSASLEDFAHGCTAAGTYAVGGRVVHIAWEGPDCSRSASWDREAVRVDVGLVLVDPANGSSTHYVSDTTPRSLWRLDATDGTGASTTMEILGSAETQFIEGCYWSTDRACGGLFSCGGIVSAWTTDATTFHATTGCSGDCPCGAVLMGTARASGGYDATFTGTNCTRMFSGAFSATELDTP